MPLYALLDATGKILRRQDFAGAAPVLAAEKGLRWVTDAPPDYDPATHTAPQPVLPVSGEAVEYAAAVANPLDPEANARATKIRAAQEKLASLVDRERTDALLELLALMPGWPPQP